jgi:pimeloyl-ACP methyl ester carboxylesterase
MRKSSETDYLVCGKGAKALVLLHGFIFDKNVWGVFSEELAHKYTLVLFDLPGHGSAPAFSEKSDFEDFALHVREVMHDLGYATFSVVGHSMGGYAALALATVFPMVVTSLVLINSTSFADSEERKAQRLRTIELIKKSASRFYHSFIPSLFRNQDDGKITPLIARASNNNTEGIIRAIEVMRERKDYSETLSITCIPILFYAGKFDCLIPEDHYRMVKAALPHSEIVMSEHSAHMSFLEEPFHCAEAVKRFLESRPAC